MNATRVEPGFDQQKNSEERDAAHGLAPDFSRVLIAGNSQINRIVVARIVQRCGLKPVSETPASAVRVLPLMFPGLVVLDGGADNKDCDIMIAGIMALRRVAGGRLPAVILLSIGTDAPVGASLASVTDAVVTKPFTAEQLQPAIERLLKAARR